MEAQHNIYVDLVNNKITGMYSYLLDEYTFPALCMLNNILMPINFGIGNIVLALVLAFITPNFP